MTPSNRTGTLQDAVESKLGVVVSLDHAERSLTLTDGEGKSVVLAADPRLLRNLRVGGPVHVLLRGITVVSARSL